MSDEIAALIAELEEEKILRAISESLARGESPLLLIETLRKGMEIVGERFEKREYFLSELIMSAEIFKEGIELIKPHIKGRVEGSSGTVVIGTVQGDIHDIGKNIVATMLECAGYSVLDLGVDVDPEAFVEEARKAGKCIVALSGLLTIAFDAMKNTVAAIEESGLRDRVKIIIGGGAVNEKVLEYSKADAYGRNAMDAVRLAREILKP